MNLLVLSVSTFLLSALLAQVSRKATVTTAVGVLGVVVGCALGMVPAVEALLTGQAATTTLPWRALGQDVVLGIDPLSAFFLVPLLLLSAVTSVYGRGYLLHYRSRSLGPPTFAFNVLVASMVLVVLARSAIIFLVVWEAMTLMAYLLVSFDHQENEVRRAGWIFLLAAHVGVACLMAMFLLLDSAAGGLGFEGFRDMPHQSAAFYGLIFVLATLGFGVKAGFLPLHVWLPEAHAAAPSHVSALMSGVLIKLGLYGLLRVTTFLPPAWWWGPLLIVMGLAAGLLGISLAISQRDLKRVLAYSSIENIGLITLGLGIAFWGASQGWFLVAALGAGGALLHLWNHVLMKGLMFLSAGSVLHGSGSKDLEKLGGLLKRMPRTGGAMLLGGVAIAGLPPLNGFVSEWMLYLGLVRGGLVRGGASGVAALLGVGILALIGGLAALCFVRLLGTSLLGEARSPAAREAHESSAWLWAPMGLLAALSFAVALFPAQVVGTFGGVVGQVFGATVARELASLQGSLSTLGYANAAIWLGLGVGALLWSRMGKKRAEPVETWGCGYVAPTARMQYTARSFGEMLADRMLPGFLRAAVKERSSTALFPAKGSFSTHYADPLTRKAYEPFFAYCADRFARLRFLQQGALNVYLLYILVVLVLALGWMSLRAWMST